MIASAPQLTEPSLLAQLIDEIYRLNGRLIATTRMVPGAIGLGHAHSLILVTIARSIEPPTVPRIGRALGHSRQAVQRLANDLAAAGYIEFVHNPDHRRAKRLVLTEMGWAAFVSMDSEGEKWLDQIGGSLDPEAVSGALGLLHVLRERIEAVERASR